MHSFAILVWLKCTHPLRTFLSLKVLSVLGVPITLDRLPAPASHLAMLLMLTQMFGLDTEKQYLETPRRCKMAVSKCSRIPHFQDSRWTNGLILLNSMNFLDPHCFLLRA